MKGYIIRILVKVNYQTKIMKKITGVIVLLTFLMTGTAHAGTIDQLLTSVNVINGQMSAMQKQIDDLKTLNGQLQAQINNVQNLQPQIETVSALQSQITNTDIKVQAVETRIGVVEKAVTFLQTKVMDALNTTIGLLKQLLKIK